MNPFRIIVYFILKVDQFFLQAGGTLAGFPHIVLNIFNPQETLLNNLEIVIEELRKGRGTSVLSVNVTESLTWSEETSSVTDINFIAFTISM